MPKYELTWTIEAADVQSALGWAFAAFEEAKASGVTAVFIQEA